MDRAQRIHQAMLSRGFDGTLRSLRVMHWRNPDSLFLAICWGSCLLARQVDLAQMLGRLALGRAG
jgi:cobalt/nickel transport system permease protein